MAKVDPKILDVLEAWAEDFESFLPYLKLVDKDANTITLTAATLREAQKVYLEAINQHHLVYVLKGRQLGLTTIIAMRMFWRAFLSPDHRVLVVAHRRVAAENIFRIYKGFYEGLPAPVRNAIRCDTSNVREMVFSHGGSIKVTSAGSEDAVGGTYHSIHASEFALWDRIGDAVAAILQAAGPTAEVVLETTPRGLNEAFRLWNDPNSGFAKVFIPWTLGDDYVSKVRPAYIPDVVEEYARKHNLPRERKWWVAHHLAGKGLGDWQKFQREYPITADTAFQMSGDKVFPPEFIVPHVTWDHGPVRFVEPWTDDQGKVRWPRKHRLYSMGVDVAAGSQDGDYSALVVLDVTDDNAVFPVESWYGRESPIQFQERCLAVAERWQALAVVEANSYGLGVIEYLHSAGYAWQYRRAKFDNIKKEASDQLGFYTNSSTRGILISRLLDYIINRKMKVIDPRLQHEINTFVYIREKPQADAKCHDDMIMAYGLALVGIDQVGIVDTMKVKEKPANLREILEYEIQSGKRYAESRHEFYDPISTALPPRLSPSAAMRRM